MASSLIDVEQAKKNPWCLKKTSCDLHDQI